MQPNIVVDQGYVEQKQFDDMYTQANKTAMIISGLLKHLRTPRPNRRNDAIDAIDAIDAHLLYSIDITLALTDVIQIW